MIYLPFTFEELPVRKTFTLEDGRTFQLEVHHNEKHDFFTLYVFSLDDELIYSTKLCYLRDAFHCGIEALAGLALVPYDFDNDTAKHPIHDRLSASNFNRVRLVVA